MDLEPPDVTLDCLFRIPFDTYRFRIITFETDEYKPGGIRRRDVSREYLLSQGYQLVGTIDDFVLQDDVYVYPSLMPSFWQITSAF